MRHLALCHIFHFGFQINSYIHIITKHPGNNQCSFVTFNWNSLHWRFCLMLHEKHLVKVSKLFPLRKQMINFQYECHLFYQCNSTWMTTFCLVQLLLLVTLTSYLLTVFSNPTSVTISSSCILLALKGWDITVNHHLISLYYPIMYFVEWYHLNAVLRLIISTLCVQSQSALIFVSNCSLLISNTISNKDFTYANLSSSFPFSNTTSSLSFQ